MMGLAVEWGIKRGIYANEAGQGSGPHAAAASEVSHPAKQGYVQAFAIYFDTMMVCTATAFLILASGTYNVYSPVEGAAPIFQGLAGIPEGAGYAQAGVEAVLPGWVRRSYRWPSSSSPSPPSWRTTTWPRPTSAM